MGDNYLCYITSTTQHLYTNVTCFISNLIIIIYYLVWIMGYIISCLTAIIHSLSNNVVLFQEYRSTLLVTTPNIKE